MNEQQESPNERLEAALRAWGAEEAARKYQQPPRPVQKSAVGRSFRVIAAWSALAATVLIAAAVAIMFIAQATRGVGVARRPSPATGPATAPADRRETDRLNAALARAQSDLEKARSELEKARSELGKAQADLEALRADSLIDGEAAAELMDRLAEQEIEHMVDVAELEADLEAMRTRSAGEKAKLADEVKRLTGQLEAQEKKLSAADDELTKAKDAVAIARVQSDAARKEVEDVRQRLTVANAEITRAAQARQDALEAAGNASKELVAVKARQASTLAGFQALYLSLLDGGQGGWAGRQKAAKSAQLLPRFAELRPSVRGEAASRLVDKLEVLLTRLELLDTADVRAVKPFADLAASVELAGAIDAVLAAGDQPPAVRQWLLEARLILTGGQSVT